LLKTATKCDHFIASVIIKIIYFVFFFAVGFRTYL